jgi:hypothetical protein
MDFAGTAQPGAVPDAAAAPSRIYMKKTIGQETLEHRILHGLCCEWETALWVLDEPHRQRMRPPLFCLRDYRRTWGTWSRERREISLSRDLVLRHSWDAVLEVLLHEMAHQFTEEVLGTREEPSHGPAFQRACHLLRANPKASGRYVPLDDRMARGPQGPEDRTVRRVRKLMALAESPNRHEAEVSMAKAHELIAKHNLHLLEQDDRRDFASVFVGKPALRHPREDYALANLLQEFYFVQGIWVPAYVLEKGKMGRVLEISGTEQNIRLASYVHDFVCRFIEAQWRTYNERKGLSRRRKTDYAAGIIEGFRSKLASQDKEKKPEGKKALIKLRDPLLEKYVAYRYPRTVNEKRAVSARDEKVVSDGRAAGKKLVIHKGITEKRSGRRRLIQGGS